MKEPVYAGATAIAPAVYAHFAGHIAMAQGRGEVQLASIADVGVIAAMIDAAFWASLRREEGFVPKISLAFVRPEESPQPLTFERPLPLEPGALTRVAPAVERPGIHLAVAQRGDDLVVWGTVRNVPKYCCVIEVAEPGLIVVKHHRGEELAKFVNVAVLQGDQIKLVDEHASSLPDCPDLLASLLGFDAPASWAASLNVLVQLAVSMRAHRRGGLLLVVPPDSTAWLESVVQPIRYSVSPPFTELALLSREQPVPSRLRSWREELARAVDSVAGLTAVDGATVVTADYALLAFGAKIARRQGALQIDQVTVTEPIAGGSAAVVDPAALGGTRHLSAAQFVHDQQDAIALVASQDGHFTVFAWSPCEGMVHAHRVEALLL
jgi:hypothetical protein